ncbi:hypothetical protein OVY48_09985 [Sphingobium sp. SA2]|uniref:hypothetical protein n=1 Tax=Sphingobium sp. SA2 TaxID=1524832 RepID=UPI0028C109E1|nr:hypothetical protein [Sphingobium sp. SA2]MDT7533753.1 hypothetical protein [Sphingobium sp. SA2]
MDRVEQVISDLKDVQTILDEGSSYFEAVEAAIVLLSSDLPCSVKLPPNTIICAGCSINTLFAALSLHDRPSHFGEGDA